MSHACRGRGFILTALLVATQASGSGFSFGENGVRALSMGGAFVGQADDLSALQHNPAGLHQLAGLQFLVDGQLFVHQVDFQRTNAAGDPGFADPVSNSGGAFFAPFAAVSYGVSVAERPLTLALGVYGPPAVGRYQYPPPSYARGASDRYIESPNRTAPQRYALLRNDTLILFPSLAASWAIHPRFAVGASLQYVYSRFIFSQAITAALYTPQELQEDPYFDSTATVNLTGRPAVTGALGLWFRPIDRLSIGVSARPPVRLTGTGTLQVAFGEGAQAAGASVSGDRAELRLSLPLELKVGAHLQVLPSLGFNADVLYEGWGVLDEIVLAPQGITLQPTGSAAPQPLEDVRLTKRWRSTFGFRAGAEYAFGFGLTLRAGVLYEQGAALPQHINIDFPHFTRVFLTAGAGIRLGFAELVGALAFLPTGTVDVNNSEVRAYNALGYTGSTVGNGSYASGGLIGSIGLRGHFGARR